MAAATVAATLCQPSSRSTSCASGVIKVGEVAVKVVGLRRTLFLPIFNASKH